MFNFKCPFAPSSCVSSLFPLTSNITSTHLAMIVYGLPTAFPFGARYLDLHTHLSLRNVSHMRPPEEIMISNESVI